MVSSAVRQFAEVEIGDRVLDIKCIDRCDVTNYIGILLVHRSRELFVPFGD